MSEKMETGEQLNSLDCWDYSIELECLRGPEDLQLAAELGKTLLERNKELETSLKQHQNIIEDQTQEIEYLTKQTVALREVNDSRLRIYEQLEVSIHDLERANHRLTLDAASDKKQIKSLCASVDSLEVRCEELQGTVEQLTRELELYKRKCERVERIEVKSAPMRRDVCDASQDKQVQCDSTSQTSPQCRTTTSTSPIKLPLSQSLDMCDSAISESDTEQLTAMLAQLRDCRTRSVRDQRRVVELEEQLAALVQENQQLENQLVNASTRDEDMKSMHDELNTLDEVRQGQLCARCLRNVDDRLGTDDMSILDTEEEDDDMSMMDALISETRYRSSVSLNIQQDSTSAQSNNLYRDLVEKYEALLAVNRNHAPHKPTNCLSLQEELQMSGDFNNIHAKDTDEESGHGDSYNQIKSNSKDRKNFSQTPTDFSEAETSSSGFADETSNKSTQTDGRPGSFLCTIADGDDCKFSIYDDASPIDSRFRNRPEYRELFKEIFTVLKKAAENKDEGEELPLLDDCTPIVSIPKVPPVTPATEEFPGEDFTDDNQSVISSAMSDISTKSNEPPTVVENVTPEVEKEEKVQTIKQEEEIKEETKPVPKEENKAPVLTPYKREPLEYLSVSVNVRKKSASKKNNKKQFIERSDSPVLPLSPRINYLSGNNSGKKRKEQRPNTIVDTTNTQVWNGSTIQFWSTNRNVASPTPSQNSGKSMRSWDYKPSTASQDLIKLKRLDLSYAEVLRNADNKKREVFVKSVRRK